MDGGVALGVCMNAQEARYVDDPMSIFLIALVGALTCQALAPVAWVLADQHLARCAEEGQTPDPYVRAGRGLAIFGTVVLGLAVASLVLFGGAAVVVSIPI